MKPEKTAEELLRWRLEQAKVEAPPAPSAAQLLELARLSSDSGQMQSPDIEKPESETPPEPEDRSAGKQ